MEFTIKHADGTTLLLNSRKGSRAVTSAKQSKTLLSEDTLSIEIIAAEPVDVRIGDTISVFGTTYTLNQLPTVSKTAADKLKYSLTFEGLQYSLIDRIFLLPDNTVDDNLMTDLRGVLEVLVDNANRNNTGKPFKLAACPNDTIYQNIAYTDYNCLRALQQICDDWDVEFVLKETNTAIELHVGTFGNTFTLPFSVGRQGGAYELQRNKPNDDIITRLYAYGGTENLTYYRHTRLCLPGATRLSSYVEDTDVSGTFGIREGVKNFDDIYPKRAGTVTALGSNYKTFVDNSIDFDLNAKWPSTDAGCDEWLALRGVEDTEANRAIYFDDVAGKTTRYLIAGTTAQVHFQTGALAGYDIDIESYDHATHTLRLIPLVDGNQYEFPSATNNAFRIAVGDEYIFVGINLPESYKTAAEAELLTAATDHYNTTCRPRASYTLRIAPLWLERVAGDEGTTNIFDVGDFIHVTDAALGIDADIRIQAFERDCLNPYDYQLTIADDCAVKTTARVVGEIGRINNIIEASGIADPNRQRRAWLTAQEVLNRTFDTEGHYYSDKIAPLSIETQMLAVGARSQQYVLANVLFTPNAGADPAKLTATTGQLIHYTIDDGGVRTWTMSALSVSGLATTALYVYAKCSRSGGGGVFVVDAVQRTFDADATYYYFLVGTLSSVDSTTNTRILSLTYGSTTINGRYIKTGRISSNDGNTYFDLDTGAIVGNFTFRSSGKSVETVVNAAQSTADAASSAASSAATAAANAKSAAEAAQSSASSAASKASTAYDKAATAINNASTASAEAAKAAAAAQAAQADIDGLQVGGRNIVTGTAAGTTVTCGSSGPTYATLGHVSAWRGLAAIAEGDQFTISFDYHRISDGSNGNLGAWWALISETKYVTLMTTKQYTEGHNVFVETVNSELSKIDWREYNVRVGTNERDGSFSITNLKIELGNCATDWTPAPEEVESDIATAQSTADGALSAAKAAQSTADGATLMAQAAISGNMWRDQYFDKYTYSNIYSGTDETVPLGKAIVLSKRDHIYGDNIRLTAGHYYRIRCTAKRTAGSLALRGGVWINVPPSHKYYPMSQIATVGDDGWSTMSCVFQAGSTSSWGSYTAGRLYFQIEQASSGGTTTWLVSNVTWEDVTTEFGSYLARAFAQYGSTEISGGVVLSNLLGVKALNGSYPTAGLISGSTNDVAIFAGAPSNGAWADAAFRVTYEGEVTMTQANITSEDNGGNYAQIAGGAFVIKSADGTKESSFSGKAYANLSGAGAGGALGSSTSKSMTGRSVSNTTTETSSGGFLTMQVTASASYTYATVSIAANTSINLPAIKATVSGSATISGGTYSESYNEYTVQLKVLINDRVISLLSGSSASTTFAAQTVYTQSGGTLKIVLFAEYRHRHVISGSGTHIITETCTVRLMAPTFTLTTQAGGYVNKYFSNGFVLTSAINRFFGLLCDASDGLDLSHRNGTYGFDSQSGYPLLMVKYSSSNSKTRWRMNPLVLILRGSYSGSKYTVEALYNPLGLSIPASASRGDTGNVTVTHNLGHTSYHAVPVGVYSSTTPYIKATVGTKTSSTVQLYLADDASVNDGNFEISFFDYKTY